MIGWLRFFGVCLHPTVIRERRDQHGVPVPAYVCLDCGKSLGPVIRRQPSQHVAAFTVGQRQNWTVIKGPADVVPMRKRA